MYCYYAPDTEHLKLYWIQKTPDNGWMEHQLKQVPNIRAKKILGVDTGFISINIQSNRIVTNGFEIVAETNESSFALHIRKQYTYAEVAHLFSHLKALEQIAAGHDDIAIVAEDDVFLWPNFYKNVRNAIKSAPADWEILQMYTNNHLQRQHNTNIDIDWLHWLPHHGSVLIYVVRKLSAVKLVTSIKRDNVYLFPHENVVLADEFLYFKTKTYTYVPQLTSHKSHVPPQTKTLFGLDAVTRTIHPTSMLSLLVYTIVVVENRHIFDQDIKSLRLQIKILKAHYTKPPTWHVVLSMVSPDMHDYINSKIQRFGSDVTFDIEFESGMFSKWKYMISVIPRMKDFDDILIKDFDQSLVGFAWKTFVLEKGTAVMAAPIREAIDESMTRHWFHHHKRQWYQVNDAMWWRHTRKTEYMITSAVERPFIEMFFVLMDGRFAHWFFSEIFHQHIYIHPGSSWGPDLMWCGAAQEWSKERTPCVVVPVTTFHYDTMGISRHFLNISSPAKYLNEPIQTWFKNKTFNHWFQYSKTWLEKWCGYNPGSSLKKSNYKWVKNVHKFNSDNL
jgi:GR25 family glycosyltransferase involved in LPS biosynthesis